MTDAEVRVFQAGDLPLRSGRTLPDARLVYAVHGSLDAARDNAILLPTCYGGTHEDVTYLIGPDRALDPERYCIVVPNMFGNGVSSSPSTTPSGEPFPLVAVHDNVTAQHRLLTEELGIRRLQLAIGFSMGGQQVYEWAARFPEMVPRLAVLCGAARTAPHTWVFLAGVTAALRAGTDGADPGTDPDPETDPAPATSDAGRPTAGKRALARVWAGWGLSQAWYRERRYLQEGFPDLEAFLRGAWEEDFTAWDSRDLLAMAATWQAHDIGGERGSQADYETALERISAVARIMPCRTDLYFPPEDSAEEVRHLRHGRLVPIDSVFGHAAGGGADPDALDRITGEIRALLGESPGA